MEKAHVVVLLALLSFSFVMGQETTLDNYDTHIGTALPSSPVQFYDYWQNGILIGGGFEYKKSEASSHVLSVEYVWFGFDKEKFFKAFQLSEQNNSISGASTNIISLSYAYKYFPVPESYTVRGYLLLGGAAVTSIIGGVEATYSDYATSQNTTVKFGISAGAGIGYQVKINSEIKWFVEGRYFFGLLRKSDANTVFHPIVTGLRMTL